MGHERPVGAYHASLPGRGGVCLRCMQRTNIFLTEEQQRRLDRRAEEEGVTKSSLIRQILDEALAIKQTAIGADVAIRESSGIWADRDDPELDDILRWRHEAPLERLSR